MALFENFPYTNFHDLNLDWIIKNLKKILDNESEQNEKIEQLSAEIENLQKWINDFNPDFIRSAVLEYIQSILATMIFVEITDAGYFVYHIPESWEDITFNTTELDIQLALQPEYGHLVLSY